MLSQNIFQNEQKGLRRKVKGLANEEAKSKKPRKVIGDSQSQIYEQLGKMTLPQTK